MARRHYHYRNNEAKPNYFLSIPIENDGILENFKKFRNELLKLNPSLNEFIVPETKLHITLCVLKIDNMGEMNKVVTILNNLRLNLPQYLAILLGLEGIDILNRNVLYAKCKSDQYMQLSSIRNQLLETLNNENINTPGNFRDYKPHLTIVNVNNQSITNYIDKNTIQNYQNSFFGAQRVSELHLCKMSHYSGLSYPIEHILKLDKNTTNN